MEESVPDPLGEDPHEPSGEELAAEVFRGPVLDQLENVLLEIYWDKISDFEGSEEDRKAYFLPMSQQAIEHAEDGEKGIIFGFFGVPLGMEESEKLADEEAESRSMIEILEEADISMDGYEDSDVVQGDY